MRLRGGPWAGKNIPVHRERLNPRWVTGLASVTCAGFIGLFGDAQAQIAIAPSRDSISIDMRDCSAQFAAFVAELDVLLAKPVSIIDPVNAVLRKHFPMHGCDVEKVIDAARRSTFFSAVTEMQTYFVIAFDSAGLKGNGHLQISIGFIKASGDSSLPFAQFKIRF
jgi:hypothetical protein